MLSIHVLTNMKLIISFFLFLSLNLLAQEELTQIKNLLLDGSDESLKKIISTTDKQISTDAENPVWYYFRGTAKNKLNIKNSLGIPELEFNQAKSASFDFQKVIELDPDYYKEINLLDPYTSLSATWGSLAFKYLNINSDSAKVAFEEGKKAGAFNAGSLGFCKNLLKSAAKDSYLFISGDNYTFSLLYLQYYEGFRKDVVVINLELANLEWYLDYLDNKYLIKIDRDIQYSSEAKRVKLMYGRSFNWDLVKYDGFNKSNKLLISIVNNYGEYEEIYFAPYFDSSLLLSLNNHLEDQGTILQISDKEANFLADNFHENLANSDFSHLSNSNYLNSRDAALLNDYYRYQYMRLIHSKIMERDVGNAIAYYEEFENRTKDKYFHSSSDQITDYVERISTIISDIKKLRDKE